MDARRLLMGDWHPWLRDPIDLARFLYAGATVVWLVLHGADALGVAVTGAAVLAVRPLELPRPYDAAFIVAMGLNGWGEALRLYDAWAAYDLVTHSLVPLLGAQIAYVFLARIDLVPDPADDTERHHEAGIFVVTLALGLALGAIWELVEWTSDHAFGSELQEGLGDTMVDLLADAVGAAIGAALLVVWTVYGWGTVRRAPGEPTAAELEEAAEADARHR